jgi:hypothetical protein
LRAAAVSAKAARFPKSIETLERFNQMFAKHQPLISQFARQNPDNFAAVCRFVVVTIQNRLFNVVSDCETLAAALSDDATAADLEAVESVTYGHKRQAVDTIQAEKAALYWQAEEIVFHAETERQAAKSLIALFATIPGLGIVKSGFIAQLIYGCGGCLDTHNLIRFGINPNKVRSTRYKNAKTLKTKSKILDEYLDFCEQFGGCEELWNTWCEFVANREDETGFRMNGNRAPYDNPEYSSPAEYVSALHCIAIGICPETGKETREW